MFFRTEKDKYDLEFVVAVTDDRDFVNLTGLNWHETDQDVVPGDYWFNGKIVKPGSTGYEPIAKIIKDKVDQENVLIRAKEAEIQEQINKIQAGESVEEILNEVLPPDPYVEPTLEERIAAVKELPPPVYVPIQQREEVPESTLENYKEWKRNHADTLKLISAVENATDDNPNVIVFQQPVTLAEGTEYEHTISEMLIPDIGIQTHLNHLKTVAADQAAFVEKIKNDLGI